MDNKSKVVTFKKKTTKVVDRTQAEIMKNRKEKRNELINKLKKNKS